MTMTSPRLAAKFVGTYLLVFTVGCNVLGNTGIWGALPSFRPND